MAEAAADPVPAAAAASHTTVAAASQAGTNMPDLPEADNIEQLLARMSIGGLLGAGQSAAIVPEQHAEPKPQAAATTATALATAALSAPPAAAAAARAQSTSPTGKSWAAVIAPHHGSM